MTSTTVNPNVVVEPAAIKASAEKRIIHNELSNGRIIDFPADRCRILKQATKEQLAKVQTEVNGYALRWKEIDEDIIVKSVVTRHFQSSNYPLIK